MLRVYLEGALMAAPQLCVIWIIYGDFEGGVITAPRFRACQVLSPQRPSAPGVS